MSFNKELKERVRLLEYENHLFSFIKGKTHFIGVNIVYFNFTGVKLIFILLDIFKPKQR